MINTLRYILVFLFLPMAGFSAEIFVNQVAFDTNGPKMAVVGTTEQNKQQSFAVVDAKTFKVAYKGILGAATKLEEWAPGKFFYTADFSSLKRQGSMSLK